VIRFENLEVFDGDLLQCVASSQDSFFLLTHLFAMNSTVGGRQRRRESTLDNCGENAYEGMLCTCLAYNMVVSVNESMHKVPLLKFYVADGKLFITVVLFVENLF